MPTNHALEQASWLDDVHLDRFHHIILDDHMNITVALDTGNMIDIKKRASQLIPRLSVKASRLFG